MTSRMTKILTGVAALVAVAAIASALAGVGASTAPPMAPVNLTVADSHYASPNPPPNADVPIPRAGFTPTVAVASDGAGFNWSAAAIGAVASAGAFGVLIGLALNTRRRHEPTPV